MYKRPSPSVSVDVRATVPLLRAGLERIVVDAGLRLAWRGETSPVVLHTPEHPGSGAAVDVCASEGIVTLTITTVPDPQLWQAMPRLLQSLLDPPPQNAPNKRGENPADD